MDEPQNTEQPADAGRDLAQWLRESASRRAVSPQASDIGWPSLERRDAAATFKARRALILSTLLSLAYLQYFFIDVLLQIESLRSLVVFVPLK